MNQEARHHVILNFLEHEGALTLRVLSAKCGIDQTTLWQDLEWLTRANIVAKEDAPRTRFQAKTSRHIYRLENMA